MQQPSPPIALNYEGAVLHVIVHNCTIFLCSLDVGNIDVVVDFATGCILSVRLFTFELFDFRLEVNSQE